MSFMITGKVVLPNENLPRWDDCWLNILLSPFPMKFIVVKLSTGDAKEGLSDKRCKPNNH